MKERKQISVSREMYFKLLQMKVHFKIESWNDLFDCMIKMCCEKNNEEIEKKLKEKEIIKLH